MCDLEMHAYIDTDTSYIPMECFSSRYLDLGSPPVSTGRMHSARLRKSGRAS